MLNDFYEDDGKISFCTKEGEFELSYENGNYIKNILPKFATFEKESLNIYEEEELKRINITINLSDIIKEHFEKEEEIDFMIVKLAKFVEDYVTKDEEYTIHRLTRDCVWPIRVNFLETNLGEIEINPDDFVITAEFLEAFALDC